MASRTAVLLKSESMSSSSTSGTMSSPTRSLHGGGATPAASMMASSRFVAKSRPDQSQSQSHHQQLDNLITLPPHQQQAMLDKVNDTVSYVLKSMLTDRKSTITWKPKMEKKNVSYYVDDNVAPDQYRFCCMSDTNAPVHEIMKLFLMTNTEMLLKNYRIVYNNVLDARVLSVLSYPTAASPYKSVYVRYSSFATPKLMDNRDMCVTVATDVFTHVDGSTIGYCLWDSADLPDICPDYSKSHGLVRSRMFRSGFVLRKTNDGQGGEETTKMVYLVGLEAGGIAPKLATKLVMEKFGANLSRVGDYFRRKSLNPTTFLPRAEWAVKKDAKFCCACTKKFSSLAKKNNCVACGDVVCKACYTRENVDLPGAGITSMRFCFACLEQRGVDGHRNESSPKMGHTMRESHRRHRGGMHTITNSSSPQSVDGRGGF